MLLGLAVVAAFAAHVSGTLGLRLLDELESLAYDTRVRLSVEAGQDRRIVIVDIDESSLRAVGQWPWPRERLARLVDNLFGTYDVAVFGVDMVFAERDSRGGRDRIEAAAARATDEASRRLLLEIAGELDGDRALAGSMRGRPVVLGYYFNVDKDKSDSVGLLPEPVFENDGFMSETIFAVEASGYNANLPVLQQSAAAAGFFSDPLVDADGVTRRVPLLHEYQGALYESLALAVARTYLDEIPVPVFGLAELAPGVPLMEALELGDRVIRMDSRSAVMIPYRGKRGSFPYVPAAEILEGRVDNPEVLDGAIALLGSSALGLADLRATPVDAVYPGVEAHANVVAGIIDQKLKSASPYSWAIELAGVVGLGLVLALVLPFLSPVVSALLSASVLAAVLIVNFLLWRHLDLIIPVATTMVTIGSVYVLNAIYNLFKGERHIKEVSKSFSSYLAPALVSQLIENPASLKLEGENRNMTFLFTDIEGFTSFTETTEATLLVDVLNEYLDQACQIIMDSGGTIDKMIGDAVVAIYNAPLEIEDHPERAVRTALALDEFCMAFMRRKNEAGMAMGITRIGINTGDAVVGNFGGENRFDYTVIGDAVNTAARLESVNKYLGTRICVSGATAERCPNLHFRPVATLVLKGKTQGVGVFEPLTGERFRSEGVQRYLGLYPSLEAGGPDCLPRLERLADDYPDDPVLRLHRDRLTAGESGVRIVLDEK